MQLPAFYSQDKRLKNKRIAARPISITDRNNIRSERIVRPFETDSVISCGVCDPISNAVSGLTTLNIDAHARPCFYQLNN